MSLLCPTYFISPYFISPYFVSNSMKSLPLSLAPGALHSPLFPSDKIPQGLWTPPVTIVFCAVEEGRMFCNRHRKASLVVHQELLALMRTVLRQVGVTSWNECRRQANLEVHIPPIQYYINEMRCYLLPPLQIPGGYLVKHFEGDLRFMLSFDSPESALLWCLAVQVGVGPTHSRGGDPSTNGLTL